MYEIRVSNVSQSKNKMRRVMWDLEDYQDAEYFANDYLRYYTFVLLIGPGTDKLFGRKAPFIPHG